jgi:hypothetical protein
MPKDEPLFPPFSIEPRYAKFVELPKFQVLADTPSFTEFALNPETPAVIQKPGLFVYALGRRGICAVSVPAPNITIDNAREKRLIMLLQVVLRFARAVG